MNSAIHFTMNPGINPGENHGLAILRDYSPIPLKVLFADLASSAPLFLPEFDS